MNFIVKDDCHNCYTGIHDIIPLSIDWREHNAVTEVKNQGDCGSCWSFSSTGSIEGINAITYKKLHNASEQQLIDCSVNQGNRGCQGGLMDNAFKYVINNGGLCSEEEYPYQGEMGFCRMCKNVVSIDDYSDVTPNDEKVLMPQSHISLYLLRFKQIYHHLDFIKVVFIKIIVVPIN